MKKKLTLLILLLPFVAFTQTQYNNGTISIDFGKKNKQQQEDTVKKEKIIYPSDEEEQEDAPKAKKEKRKPVNNPQEEKPDFKRDGLFKALFHGGLNACQIDGDGYAGYNYLGADLGVGAMVRFHRYLSVSMELNYSMKGAKQKFIPSTNPISRQLYRVAWDYMEVPVSLNVHDKKLVMASLGLSVAAQVRYRERDEQGQDDTNALGGPPGGEPRKFDLCAWGAFYFLIKQHFAVGLKFSYSLLKIRGPQYPGLSRVNGEYNNVLSLRLMYILDKSSLKKK